eukprot:5127232-Alexandrium_andersonii.AAC.1
MREQRKERPANPALNETVEFIRASDAGAGVMRALAPGSMTTLYVGNIICPTIALALGKGAMRALAGAEPDAVARYASRPGASVFGRCASASTLRHLLGQQGPTCVP